ncbi:MAG: hypothetical protein IAE82_08800 [Opitutaceae bacterium]|nr:hypothetical protein [Opitutaceae bacterium]
MPETTPKASTSSKTGQTETTPLDPWATSELLQATLKHLRAMARNWEPRLRALERSSGKQSEQLRQLSIQLETLAQDCANSKQSIDEFHANSARQLNELSMRLVKLTEDWTNFAKSRPGS